MLNSFPIIGVVGSHEKEWEALAAPLGRMIADYDYHLLTGAGGGVMTAVARSFTEVESRKGLSIGIVPTEKYDGSALSRDEYPNPYIELPIITPLDAKAKSDSNPYSRNQVNIMSSNALIVLPGDHGTRNEVSLALQYHKNTILYGPEAAFEGFPQQSTCVEDINAVREFLETIQSNFKA